MSESLKSIVIPDEVILNKILLIRDLKVMLDSDLAKLYGVTTKRLNEQVKRNIKRFPEDFMIQLTDAEKAQVVANCDHLKKLKYSPYLPLAFTEHGVVMLAGVLNSDRAILINIQIVRIFNKMRKMLTLHKDVLIEIEQIKNQISDHESRILVVFEYLKQFEKTKQEELEYKNRPRIGFKKQTDE
jgi:phage regulator Rha-like protein